MFFGLLQHLCAWYSVYRRMFEYYDECTRRVFIDYKAQTKSTDS